MKAKALLLSALFAAPAFGVLMTPSEAEKTGDMACTPLPSGMLDCVPIAAPKPGPSNDPAIQPLPAIQYPGEQFPPPTAEAPILPALDPVPPQLKSNRLIIGWDIGFGTPAQWWEIWDNGNRIVRTSQFTQRRMDQGGAEGAERVGEVQLVAIQSGVYTLTDLAEGRHELEIRLCNAGLNGKPLCTPIKASTWVGQGTSGDEPSGPPSAPELEWLPQITTGEAIELAWNVWWGTPGSYWQVYDGDRRLFESTSFTDSTPNSQSGRMILASLPQGLHGLTVKLCSKLECTPSQPARVEVLLPPQGEVVPIVTVKSSTPDTVLLQWSVPQAALSAMPERWSLRDPADAVIGETRSDVRSCQKNDPKLAGVSVASYCGETRLALVEQTEPVRVEVCVKDLCSKSDAVDLLTAIQPAMAKPTAVPATPSSTATDTPPSTNAPQETTRGRFVVPDAALDQLLDEATLTSGTRNRR